MSIFGSIRIARAIAIRCFCPPLNLTPFSPTSVLYPYSNDVINSCALACCAANMIRSIGISSVVDSSKPNFILSSMVPENKICSCERSFHLKCALLIKGELGIRTTLLMYDNVFIFHEVAT